MQPNGVYVIGTKINVTDESNAILDWKSEIEISLSDINNMTGYDRDDEMNFCAPSNFNPKDEVLYWRCIHVVEILKNWETVIKILTNFNNKLFASKQ